MYEAIFHDEEYIKWWLTSVSKEAGTTKPDPEMVDVLSKFFDMQGDIECLDLDSGLISSRLADTKA